MPIFEAGGVQRKDKRMMPSDPQAGRHGIIAPALAALAADLRRVSFAVDPGIGQRLPADLADRLRLAEHELRDALALATALRRLARPRCPAEAAGENLGECS